MTLKKIIYLLCVVYMLCSLTIYAFAYTADIETSGNNRYVAVRLTPTIYNNGNENLSDILIKDRFGQNVPYFIHQGSSNTLTNTEKYTLELINSYLYEDYFYFDFKLAEELNRDIVSTSLVFTSRDTNFAKDINLYGSYDDIHWEFIQRDSLYSIDNKSKLTIDFIQAQKYTHYRLRLGNNLEQISFTTAQLVYNFDLYEDSYFLGTIEPEFSIENGQQETIITIEGLKNLRLCDITIVTDSMFQRSVSTSLGTRKELYHLSFNDNTYSDTTIQQNWRISRDDELVLTIYNGDDRPINISKIVVQYYAADIVFEKQAGETYTLEFGADPSKRAPVYDISRYSEEILKGNLDRGFINNIDFSEIEIPQPRDYKAVFNIVIIVVTLLLGTAIVFRLRRKD
ncbi:MAG: hypothetical protein FWG88_03380 [Oscillospiraceae bacterium]|nr:hypothetical protein [Oscillospiraceae bacterium]